MRNIKRITAMVYMSQERCISESYNNRINSDWPFRCAPSPAVRRHRQPSVSADSNDSLTGSEASLMLTATHIYPSTVSIQHVKNGGILLCATTRREQEPPNKRLQLTACARQRGQRRAPRRGLDPGQESRAAVEINHGRSLSPSKAPRALYHTTLLRSARCG
jgi:hypothetical protein